jgi:hypothetical protein
MTLPKWEFDTTFSLPGYSLPPIGAKPLPKLVFHQCAKFFNSILIRGATALKEYVLESVDSDDERLLAAVVSVQPGDGDASSSFFAVQLLVREPGFLPDLQLRFNFKGFAPFFTTLRAIAEHAYHPPSKLMQRFNEITRGEGFHRMLDIGGRARSGVLRADQFRSKEVVVLDVVEDTGVDVVCDAHQMSQVLERRSFDIVFSCSVFEHLVMPWKVAVEMNRVMRIGAIGLIVTHQTVGMHDMPWDYFRFSDSAWKGLFNSHSGFAILGTELGDIQYIIPHIYQDRYAHVEKTGGYEFSAVLVHKTSETELDWPLRAGDVTSDLYPE